MPAIITRTLNPLPFNDLEPKRFEDLVRQLIYDFRPWRRLEATGRSGSDDGFDARGYEMVVTLEMSSTDDASDEVESDNTNTDRLWLIQCKRERSINPSKLKAYLSDIKLNSDEGLRGVIFAAACDFSKRSRDAFFGWCRDQNVAEAYMWGKGELEDQLYQPKNDNLLFAYFGISLAIRRRSQTTQIRADIATKRKLTKVVTERYTEILVRDPLCTDYPYVKNGERPTKWWVYDDAGLQHDGLRLCLCWHYAYVNPNTGEWDAADGIAWKQREHAWTIDDPQGDKMRTIANNYWEEIPQENRAWLKIWGIIPLHNIVAIDKLGDDIFPGVCIYAPFTPKNGPFAAYYWKLETISSLGSDHGKRYSETPDTSKRAVKFPADTRRAD